MCTIGCVYENGVVRTFKQCDLTEGTTFFPPETIVGKAGRYLAFRRYGRPGIWAGVNECGVGFVAADYYTNEDPGERQTGQAAKFLATNTFLGLNDDIDRLLLAYETVVANYDNTQSAIDYLIHWYLNEGNLGGSTPYFKHPDIVLISDKSKAVFLEYYPGSALTLQPKAGWFASTNHARMFTQTVDYSKNHSTYLRLARAEVLLAKATTMQGIKSVLQDQYFGDTELSICRVANSPGQYFTQASVIFNASNDEVWSDYLINGNPRTKDYTVKKL